MHLFDPTIGLMGGNGIVGGGLPLVLGAGYSALYRGTDQVAICYCGEGAASQGSFHESLNMAAIMKYPILYVCENNLYAATTHARMQCPVEDIANLAAGYGIPGKVVDGNDVQAVHGAAGEAISRARSGRGPTLLECKTYRHRPHCMVIPEHRSQEELAHWKDRDPIPRFQTKLLEDATVTQTELDRVAEEVERSLDEALAFATNSPFPEPRTLTDGFWANPN
jgi:pyruvate dehydrogenase E1 component alpha subunit